MRSGKVTLLANLNGFAEAKRAGYEFRIEWIGHHTQAKPFKDCKATTKCSPIVSSFDLQGYGTLQFPEKDVYCLAGWSDKVLDMMKLLECDRQAFIKEIEQVEL